MIKTELNFAGVTQSVHPSDVRGTFEEGLEEKGGFAIAEYNFTITK
ncbi:hypothetical protein [Cupriavidus necator]